MIPYLTVTESMNAVRIFNSSGTMQVPAFQSKEKWNNGSYPTHESKDQTLCSIKKKVDQQYHVLD